MDYLQDLYDFLVENEVDGRADNVLDKIEELIHSLSSHPDRGGHPKELLALGIREYRELHFKPYRILYRVIERKAYVYLMQMAAEICRPYYSDDCLVHKMPLVQAVVRAWAWRECIESGRIQGIYGLSKKLRMDNSFVTRILKLTFLAPDITMAILKGKEPSGLCLTKLLRPFPDDWDEQRKMMGF